VAPEEWARLAVQLQDPTLLSPDFNVDTARHLAKDPFPRQFLAAFEGEHLVGTAVQAVTARVTGNDVVDEAPTLHYVRIAGGQASALKALIAHAGGERKQPVSIPNTASLSADAIKAAGLIPTKAKFVAYCLVAPHRDVPFRATDFEII
jgi:hypothetical protein